MPAVACAGCSNLVNTQDFVCKKCNEKKPFTCSKCNRRMANVDIFESEKLTFSKNLYCRECGPAISHVNCHHCKTGLVRNAGRERVSRKGETLFYHNDCWNTYELQGRTSKWVQYLVCPALAVLFLWMGYSKTGEVFPAIGLAVLGAGLGYLASWVFSPKD